MRCATKLVGVFFVLPVLIIPQFQDWKYRTSRKWKCQVCKNEPERMERCFKHKPNKHINQHIKCDSYHDYSNMDWWIQIYIYIYIYIYLFIYLSIYIYIIQVTNPYYQMGPAAAQLLSTPRQPGPRPTARRCPGNSQGTAKVRPTWPWKNGDDLMAGKKC